MVETDQAHREQYQVVLPRISHEASILMTKATDEVIDIEASVFKHNCNYLLLREGIKVSEYIL